MPIEIMPADNSESVNARFTEVMDEGHDYAAGDVGCDHSQHLRKPDLAQTVAQVEEVCKSKRLRFTDLRREVLVLLLKENAPCKAYSLLERLKKSSNQPTAIYRALDFLLEHRFIHKIHSQNAYVACPHPDVHHDCFFLVCRDCGDIEECSNKIIYEEINQTAQNSEFKDTQTFIEIVGVCRKCNQY